MFKELLHGGPETAALPDTAEAPPKCGNALNQYRSVEGASEGTAYECSRGMKWHVDGTIHRRYLGDRNSDYESDFLVGILITVRNRC
jgi:hypothetical protein